MGACDSAGGVGPTLPHTSLAPCQRPQSRPAIVFGIRHLDAQRAHARGAADMQKGAAGRRTQRPHTAPQKHARVLAACMRLSVDALTRPAAQTHKSGAGTGVLPVHPQTVAPPAPRQVCCSGTGPTTGPAPHVPKPASGQCRTACEVEACRRPLRMAAVGTHAQQHGPRRTQHRPPAFSTQPPYLC